jgi:hypothetical protein
LNIKERAQRTVGAIFYDSDCWGMAVVVVVMLVDWKAMLAVDFY